MFLVQKNGRQNFTQQLNPSPPSSPYLEVIPKQMVLGPSHKGQVAPPKQMNFQKKFHTAFAPLPLIFGIALIGLKHPIKLRCAFGNVLLLF